MSNQEAIARLSRIFEGHLNSLGFDLVDIVYRHEGDGFILRVLADKAQGGISMDECAMLNRELGGLLDANDILQGRYTLEVSSPGLDRPLKNARDFRRSSGEEVRCFLNEAINGKLELEGVIKEVLPESVLLDINGQVTEVFFSKINKARLKI